jgi:hypothetical protein
VFWALRLVQGVHTRVIEILCEYSVRSALGLSFKFREERDRWAHQNKLKLKRGDCASEGTPEFLNTLGKFCKESIE